jgi:hypothetical protein
MLVFAKVYIFQTNDSIDSKSLLSELYLGPCQEQCSDFDRQCANELTQTGEFRRDPDFHECSGG